jgi:hypothetical protein
MVYQAPTRVHFKNYESSCSKLVHLMSLLELILVQATQVEYTLLGIISHDLL